MPDITMCTGEKENQICPKRDTCWRFLAKPDEYQSYFTEAPFEDNCEYYWSIAKWKIE